METIYLGIVIFLFMLAVFDLMVGVSNDAVNFMNSAVGAKVAKFKTIIIVAAIGVFAGAVLSNGMMDIARHGIFQPDNFSFYEIMCILLAVMVTDVVLLDVFNTLGLPTSTTVSMVFELLGGTLILALLKLISDESGLTLGDLLNTEKALSVILGIFLSVAIAFIAGTFVQYISRLIFSFNYKKNLSWTISCNFTFLLYSYKRAQNCSFHYSGSYGVGRCQYSYPSDRMFRILYDIHANSSLVQSKCTENHSSSWYILFGSCICR